MCSKPECKKILNPFQCACSICSDEYEGDDCLCIEGWEGILPLVGEMEVKEEVEVI